MAKLEIELLPEEERRLMEEALREGLSLPEYAHRRLTGASAPPEENARVEPIWKRAAAIGARIPAADRARAPHDGSINYRHYLYDAPRQDTPPAAPQEGQP